MWSKKAAELTPRIRSASSTALQELGLGRKDSNLRMPESKSGALTSLATPQLAFNPVP